MDLGEKGSGVAEVNMVSVQVAREDDSSGLDILAQDRSGQDHLAQDSGIIMEFHQILKLVKYSVSCKLLSLL